ncbi:hypothetical protein BU24DRAFT_106356 [Aaosphaeria arxii CBS 175.79]|uniref:Uncharacterized protein n=1 Tax=Aaosphaeria arxii CBS 175.79 TaxID=1450172 RepID=A0A6A5Y197_9PLEO|nr:uncharacterized protein BU24DRAFT_106356 [Aaosphaeria arxii CBS 175.79]KAF2018847.1 hypothetical protein BU24DRAFT_106356 [Aaosphaeria arxii CBS 175.79]
MYSVHEQSIGSEIPLSALSVRSTEYLQTGRIMRGARNAQKQEQRPRIPFYMQTMPTQQSLHTYVLVVCEGVPASSQFFLPCERGRSWALVARKRPSMTERRQGSTVRKTEDQDTVGLAAPGWARVRCCAIVCLIGAQPVTPNSNVLLQA